MKENCAWCRHHDVFWDGSGCNLLNNMESCKFEPIREDEEDEHERRTSVQHLHKQNMRRA